MRGHNRDERGDRIDAKAVEGFADGGVEGLYVGPAIRQAPAAHSDERRRGVEDRLAEDNRVSLVYVPADDVADEAADAEVGEPMGASR